MSKRFHYGVTVVCETWEQAEQVMAERLGPDEDYGFDYTVSYGVDSTEPDPETQ